MPRLIDNVYALRFVYLLTRPWEELDAYKLGIIDKDGNPRKKLSDLKSSEEKDAYTRFHILVFKIKKLLEKIPLGKTTIARYATALYLVKEETGVNLDTKFSNYMLKEFGININDLIETPVVLLENTKYISVFNTQFVLDEEFMKEDMGTSGIDMPDTSLKHDDSENFGGSKVFTCDSDTFAKCRLGKTPFARYKTYVGEGEMGEMIRQYGRSNPKKAIILKNSADGSMLFLRRPK